MKIVFCYYNNINYDMRAKELLDIMSDIGDIVALISRTEPISMEAYNTITYNSKSRFKLLSYIANVQKAVREFSPAIVVLRDSCSSFIIPLLCRYKKKPVIVYDAGEMYVGGKIESLKTLAAAILRWGEKRYLKHADIVLAANIERAQYMQGYFNLKTLPFVFDNAHKIEDEYNTSSCEEKYGHLFKDERFVVLYSGGLIEHRQSFALAATIAELGKPFFLILVGSAQDNGELRLSEITTASGERNNVYCGRISTAELRYLNQKAHVTISLYPQDTLNNLYCASGKVYESLLEGTPIITSTNPPLVALCSQTQAGISSDDLKSALIAMQKNYSEYRKNAQQFAKEFDAVNRRKAIEEYIKAQYYRILADSVGEEK